MSFFGALFGEKKARSVALLDIDSTSIGGAYARVSPNAIPQVFYSVRIPIESHKGEAPEAAMERSLKALGEQLVREGAPILLRATGSGKADSVLATLSAPWQETSVRTEQIEEKKPFTFSQSLIEKALAASAVVTPGRILVDESTIGTILNGYETKKPYGKRASRASIIVLASSLSEEAAIAAARVLRSLFHTKDISLIASASLRYQAISKAFPHEEDYLILHADGPGISLALVRQGLLVAALDREVNEGKEWSKEIGEALREIAKEYPLPHAIFLLAKESERALLKQALDAAKLGSLWLSDESPTITALAPSHVINLVKHMGIEQPDLPLLLMALYANGVFEDGA